MKRVFQAFEFASYNYKNEGKEGKLLPEDLYENLKAFSGQKELPYFSLTANGVRFKNYVGVLQIGKWIVEILPKFDRELSMESTQPVLIKMLQQAKIIRINTPTDSYLRLKRNYILDAYIQMFLEETRIIMHRGLIKKYHKKEENSYALKGSISFRKHLTKNITHAERFYVKHTVYDQKHLLNRIIYKTLIVISNLDSGSGFLSEIKSLLINFPEMINIHVSDDLFERINWDRKNEHYKKAIEISRLLLLNYHPDLLHGKNDVLALMFDMNDLWEKWFAQRLRTSAKELKIYVDIKEQTKKTFWTPESGYPIKQKPDIVIDLEKDKRIIVDTKWKIIRTRPDEADLRQMYTYNHLFDSKLSYLIYPGNKPSVAGKFFNPDESGGCALAFIPFIKDKKLSSFGIRTFLKEITA